MKRTQKKKDIPVKKRYSLKDIAIICIVLFVVSTAGALAVFSIKAIVQDIQLISYENKAEGVVTYEDFSGEYFENFPDGNQYTRYYYVRFIVTFDEETAGHTQYVYTAKDSNHNRLFVGDRCIVLFNDIEDATVITKNEIITDNIILVICLLITVAIITSRKKIQAWLSSAF